VNKRKELDCCDKHRRGRYYRRRRNRYGRRQDEFLNKDPYLYEDYTIELASLIGYSLEEKIFRLNFSCLVRKVNFFYFIF
jgi:hypothetical protein